MNILEKSNLKLLLLSFLFFFLFFTSCNYLIFDKFRENNTNHAIICINYFYKNSNGFCIILKKNNDKIEIRYESQNEENIIKIDTIFFVSNINNIFFFSDFEQQLKTKKISPNAFIDSNRIHNCTYIVFSNVNNKNRLTSRSYKLCGGYFNINEILSKNNFPLFKNANISPTNSVLQPESIKE